MVRTLIQNDDWRDWPLHEIKIEKTDTTIFLSQQMNNSERRYINTLVIASDKLDELVRLIKECEPNK